MVTTCQPLLALVSPHRAPLPGGAKQDPGQGAPPRWLLDIQALITLRDYSEERGCLLSHFPSLLTYISYPISPPPNPQLQSFKSLYAISLDSSLNLPPCVPPALSSNPFFLHPSSCIPLTMPCSLPRGGSAVLGLGPHLSRFLLIYLGQMRSLNKGIWGSLS